MSRWPAVQHLSFPVRNIARSVAFYRDLLGFDAGAVISEHIAELTMGQTLLVLLRGDAVRAPEQLHFGFREASRAQVDEWAVKARTAGATIGFGPGVAEWGGYVLYIHDPDGYMIEIFAN